METDLGFAGASVVGGAAISVDMLVAARVALGLGGCGGGVAVHLHLERLEVP
ncbi:hypothetical protein [Streptomyces sp. NPDC050287]|uniref:hypothetical protein n=1 Tax=Streptomyces sp. NPDC050287 TaxID=3365608 RepID=UPI00378E27FD